MSEDGTDRHLHDVNGLPITLLWYRKPSGTIFVICALLGYITNLEEIHEAHEEV